MLFSFLLVYVTVHGSNGNTIAYLILARIDRRNYKGPEHKRTPDTLGSSGEVGRQDRLNVAG